MKLSMEDLQTLNALERLTGAKAEDVVVLPDKMIFVVPKGDIGRMVGKGGSNLPRLSSAFGKTVEVVAAAADEPGFFAGLFFPAPVQELIPREEGGKKALDVRVDVKDRGIAIGRNGEKIKRAKLLAKRFYGYDDVRIVTRG